MILPSTKIHVTGELITKQLNTLVEDKIKLFKDRNLKTAPFAEQVGVMTGFKYITTEENCGGYCNHRSRVIALNKSNWGRGEVRKNAVGLPYNQALWEQKVIFHEIGHAIQAEAEVFVKEKRLISWKLGMEWQCEGIAYKLFTECFGKVDHRYFSSYFTNEDVDFLKDWHGSLVQDDSTELSKIIRIK